MSGALVPTSLPLPHPDPFETSNQINICRRDRTREEQRQSSTLKISERRTDDGRDGDVFPKLALAAAVGGRGRLAPARRFRPRLVGGPEPRDPRAARDARR